MIAFPRLRPLAALAALAVLTAGPRGAAAQRPSGAPATPRTAVNQVVFSDATFADADWTIVHSFGLLAAGQVATGGNPGSYRQVALAVGQNVPFVGQLNRTFVYDPSARGAVLGITYNFDLITTNAEGASYAPLVEQNGRFYVDGLSAGNASTNAWTHHDLVLDLADFGELTITPLHALVFNPASTPDFSATGSALTFGYEVTAGGGGFFTSVTGIDNDPITVVTAPRFQVVPEPAPVALVGSAAATLLGLAWRRARAGR